MYQDRSGVRGMQPTRALLDGVLKYKTLYGEFAKAPANHFLYDTQRELAVAQPSFGSQNPGTIAPESSGASIVLTGAHSGTTTPIKHVVVIFDENISFDHYFGTYPNAANTDGTHVPRQAGHPDRQRPDAPSLLDGQPERVPTRRG